MSLNRLSFATPAARTVTALTLLAAVGAGISAANPEKVVTAKFAAALKQAPGTQVAASEQPVSGSEAYWLAQKRRHDADGTIQPAAWSSAPIADDISVGDRITVSTANSKRILEVVAVSAVEPAPGSMDSRTASDVHQQIAVTCRDLNSPDGRLTTFLTQASGSLSAKTARAL